MSLRTLRTVAGRATALLAAGLVVAVLALTVVVPRFGGATVYTVETGSMRPGMPPGTVVVVRPTPAAQISLGDVVTYQIRSGDPTVATHRVVAMGSTLKGGRYFTTQGDANDSADPNPVIPEQIKGVRWYSVPYLGYPSLLVGGDIRRLVMMGAILVLFGYALASFAGAFRDRRRSRRDRLGRDALVDDRESTLTGVTS